MPRATPTQSSLTWEGLKIPMEYDASGWRLRKRSRHLTVDYRTNIHGLKAAQKAGKEHLDKQKNDAAKPKGKKTLADVVEAYSKIPKKAGEAAQKISKYRLTSVVRTVTGKTLEQTLATDIDAKFWLSYIAKCQGKLVADLGDRSPKNATINSAMRTAAAIFKKALIPLYAELGIVFASDVTTIQWLPKLKVPKPAAKGDDLLTAWKAQKITNYGMWQTIGVARFAGLRRKELEALQDDWVEVDEGATYIRLCDRPEQGFKTKTGENYRAPVINEEVAKMLRDAAAGKIIQPKLISPRGRAMNRMTWFSERPQAWLKPFTGTAKKPLHRIRGLYLDEVAKLREDAEKAKLAGIKAAADAAGHTNTQTTKDSYLSD